MLGYLYMHLYTTGDMQIRGVSIKVSMEFHQKN